LIGQLGRSRSSGSAIGFAQAIAAQIRNNPVACVLIAAGIGWLVVSETLEKSRPTKRGRRVARRGRKSSERRRAQNKRLPKSHA
jgi:hypothetical protein